MSKAVFTVTVLGTASAMPLHGRHHSAQWVRYGGYHFLIDCGEATQYQVLKYNLPWHRLVGVCISHLHADHVGGLSGLLTSLHLQGRVRPLSVYGPLGLKEYLEAVLMGTYQMLRYPLYVVEVWPGQEAVCVWQSPEMRLWAFALRHGVPALGFRFDEMPGARRLHVEKAQSLGLSGAEVARLREEGTLEWQGTRLTWEDLSLPPPPPRSYAYCSDTVYDERLGEFVKQVTMLYHEATFLSTQRERARQTFHTTAAEAAALAKAAQVQKLLIGHFSARYKDPLPLLQEAQAVFPHTLLAEEGKTYPIEHA